MIVSVCPSQTHSWSMQIYSPTMTPPWASYQIRKLVGCACAGNAWNIFPATAGLAIPTCITARACRTCHDACRNRLLTVSFEVGGREIVPGIPGACATRNFTQMVRGPSLFKLTFIRFVAWFSVSVPTASLMYTAYLFDDVFIIMQAFVSPRILCASSGWNFIIIFLWWSRGQIAWNVMIFFKLWCNL